MAAVQVFLCIREQTLPRTGHPTHDLEYNSAHPAGEWLNLYSQTTYNIEKAIRFFYLATSELNWRPSRDEVRGLGARRSRAASLCMIARDSVLHRCISHMCLLQCLLDQHLSCASVIQPARQVDWPKAAARAAFEYS